MGWTRAALGLIALLAAGAVLASGGSEADPETPKGLLGLPPPFLGTAVLGSGGLTAAIDAYGDVVDLRLGPAGPALIDNPSDRQAAGTVPAATGIVPWVSLPGQAARPLWTADAVAQSYRAGSTVVVVKARFRGARVRIVYAVDGQRLICLIAAGDGARVSMRTREPAAARRLRCGATRSAVRSVERGERRWLGQARPLGPAAPAWARRMYRRSLLVLHALTDRRTGAVAAGVRDGWAYVWPRDASAAALAFAAAGDREEAERVVRFLLGLRLEEAARFHGDGSPVPGRAAQGDAIGWVAAASRAAGIGGSARQVARILAGTPIPWRDHADYWEEDPGDYLANAIASASASDVSEFSRHIWGESSDTPSPRGLVRELGDLESGLDSAAAWGVRPFQHPGLYPAIRRTLKDVVAQRTQFGILPGEGWSGDEDPWSAPTAWTAWSLAALGERREALELIAALRRSATPAGDLPERVDAQTGIPRSTTPLAWSHAFAILALRELWPS
jgi:hypothetical protein